VIQLRFCNYIFFKKQVQNRLFKNDAARTPYISAGLLLELDIASWKLEFKEQIKLLIFSLFIWFTF